MEQSQSLTFTVNFELHTCCFNATTNARQQATVATYKVEADYLQANLGHLLAWAELEQAVGRNPRI
jgi:hypothetical protein